MPSHTPGSNPALSFGTHARSTGLLAALRQRMPVTSMFSALFFGGLLAAVLLPALVRYVVLVPAGLSRPSSWYRLLTFSLVQASLPHWLVVAAVTLLSGWLAERWLEPRAMWAIGVIAALVSGTAYSLLALPSQPALGGGFVTAGFAGAAVATSVLRWQSISRGAQIAALALLLMYGLSLLRAEPSSLAMLAAFIAAGGYAGWRVKSREHSSDDQRGAT